MMSGLIYDLGLHNGGDTAHYLRDRFRVVAVDANPAMCMVAEKRFHKYIRSGQLTILNLGIAEHKGRFDFWVCDEVSEWSSFDRKIASRNGAKHHAITCQCVPIMDIIDKYGVAEYMKIDIEGNDNLCIAGLTTAAAPPYISLELNHLGGDQDIQNLAELGYRSFKVICQNNAWHQVTSRNMWFYELRHSQFFVRCIRHARSRLANRLYGRRLGESGAWGEKTSGSWHSLDHALSVWRTLHEIDKQHGAEGLGWWFDVHARKF